MPDALPLTGLFGKVPAHGDFVRRGLPTSFVGPWDSWLQDGMATARDRLGERWAALWDAAPPWRFALPAGACGPDAVAGVMLPSEDMVGRRFPITLAVLLPAGAALPGPAWFAALEAAALAGRAGQVDADALAAAIPVPGAEPAEDRPDAWPLADHADAPPLSFVADAGPVTADLLDAFGDAVPAAAGDAAAQPIDPPPLPFVVEDTPAATDVLAAFGEAAMVTTPVAEPVDDPALPGAGAANGDGPPAPPDDSNVLGFFSGAVTTEPAAAPAPTWPMSEPPARETADVLDMFGAAPPVPAASVPAAPDGTLAFLLGEGDAGAAPSMADPGSDAPAGHGAVPVADDADPLAAPPPAAPAAPSGGGWWTGGGGFRPPAVLPIAALLPAADFASLLEADA